MNLLPAICSELQGMFFGLPHEPKHIRASTRGSCSRVQSTRFETPDQCNADSDLKHEVNNSAKMMLETLSDRPVHQKL